MKRKHEKDTEGEGSREISTRLTKIEEDLLSHLQAGYQLETDSLGADPLLRRLKDNEVIRPQSVTLNTIKALEERGLIAPAEGDDPLRMVWHPVAKKSGR
jgi:hypothetical protein